MDPKVLLDEVREQLRERPYWTLAGLVGVGWILGRTLPVRALVALGGVGARVAMASALEGVVRSQMHPAGKGPSEEAHGSADAV